MHAIHNVSAGHHSPSVEAVTTAVEYFERYDPSVETYLAPASPFYTLFLGTALQAPIEFYAIAGAYNLPHLAIPISSHGRINSGFPYSSICLTCAIVT